MRPAKAALGVFRFLTPGQLAICLVLFFMPWVEVQCGMPGLGQMGANFGNPKAPPPKIAAKDLSYSPLMTQSGYQAAMGEYTLDPSLQRMMDQSKQMAKGMGGEVKGGMKEEKVKKAPVLFLFPAAALAGVVLGLVLPAGRARKFVLILCCGLALASAGTQAAIGFPITEEVKKDPEVGGGGKGKNADLGDLKPDDIIKTVYKAPFYLALLFALGGLVTTLVEPNARPKPTRDAYEEDDDLDDRDRDRDRDDRGDDSDGDRPRRERRPESDNPFENLG